MSEPSTTIITPTYQQPVTLWEAAETVFAQTRTDWRWWIVLDGANSETEATARRIVATDNRVSLFREATTEKQRAATYRPAEIWNKYFPLITTPYFVQLSDDDLWRPFFLELLINAAERNPLSSGAVGSNDAILWKGGKWVPWNGRIWPEIVALHELYRSTCTDMLLVKTDAYRKFASPFFSTQREAKPTCERELVGRLMRVGPLEIEREIVQTHRVTDKTYGRDLVLTKRKHRAWRAKAERKRLQSTRKH